MSNNVKKTLTIIGAIVAFAALVAGIAYAVVYFLKKKEKEEDCCILDDDCVCNLEDDGDDKPCCCDAEAPAAE